MRRRTVLGAAAAATAGVAGCLGGRTATLVDRRLVHDGRDRTYHYYAPVSVQLPARTVVWLHGGIADGIRMAEEIGANDLADEEEFVACYPDAIENWNDGREFGDRTVDDVGYLTTLVEELAERGITRPDEVYVAGSSGGAMMAQRLAVEVPDRFQGIASVAGLLPASLPEPSEPVPTCLVVGTADPLVPFDGGGVGLGGERGEVRSFAETVAIWRRRNGCVGDPTISRLPDEDGPVRRERHDCETPLLTYVIDGGGHGWPGRTGGGPDLLTGHTTDAIDATRICWDFFAG